MHHSLLPLRGRIVPTASCFSRFFCSTLPNYELTNMDRGRRGRRGSDEPRFYNLNASVHQNSPTNQNNEISEPVIEKCDSYTAQNLHKEKIDGSQHGQDPTDQEEWPMPAGSSSGIPQKIQTSQECALDQQSPELAKQIPAIDSSNVKKASSMLPTRSSGIYASFKFGRPNKERHSPNISTGYSSLEHLNDGTGVGLSLNSSVEPSFSTRSGSGDRFTTSGRPQPGTASPERAIDRPIIEPFDICQKKTGPGSGPRPVKLKPSLFQRNKEKRKEIEKKRCEEKLRPGMVLLKNYINEKDQTEIVKECRKLGLGDGGFYQPGYKDGAKLHLQMMCLGKNWDPETRLYEEQRSVDGAKPPPIPDIFKNMVIEAIKTSRSILNNPEHEQLPYMEPDLCIVNFYSTTGKLGLHKDQNESSESLEKGLPVVSFSVGDSAKFLYGDERDVDKAKEVLLESGDILIFGGESRHVFHGVASIIPESAPRFLVDDANLRPGRLNLTFRKY